MIDSISSGVSVIQAGMSRLEQSAQTIARQSITNPASPASTAGDLIQPLIE